MRVGKLTFTRRVNKAPHPLGKLGLTRLNQALCRTTMSPAHLSPDARIKPPIHPPARMYALISADIDHISVGSHTTCCRQSMRLCCSKVKVHVAALLNDATFKQTTMLDDASNSTYLAARATCGNGGIRAELPWLEHDLWVPRC